MNIEGIVKVGKRTKELVLYLEENDIAIICHDDIDELAALALIEKRIKIILNTGKSMTGRFESKGTATLIRKNIYLFDIDVPFDYFKDGDFVRIKNKDIIINNNSIFTNKCTYVDNNYIKNKIELSRKNMISELSNFIDNTLSHFIKDREKIINSNEYPDISIDFSNRHTLVVVRGSNSKNDLISLANYIKAYKPVLIGVDGGGDILLNCGYTPDILVGDMDSISNIGIYKSKEIVLHAYDNGYCPCMDRISKLNVRYKVLAIPGTSEDAALLLAYEKGAEQIVLVGGHSNMHDFLEKGRNGMGSTLLTRFKLGNKLIDYKGISKLIISDFEVLSNQSKNEFLREIYEKCDERDILCLKV